MRYSTEEELAEFIQNVTTPLQIVIDSGFIPRHEAPDRLWTAILQHKLIILPTVDAELRQYTPAGNDRINSAIAAARTGRGNVEVLRPMGMDSELGRGVRYYARLRGTRKEAVELAAAAFRDREGRDPSPSELESALQRLVGRGVTLARKGASDSAKPNLLFDEVTVVRTVALALERRIETLLLVRDNDIIEQFYKFGYLLDTHYRAYCIGKAFIEQPLNFPRRAAPVAGTMLEGCVEADDAEFVKLPASGTRRCLPDEFEPMAVHCVCLAGREPPSFKDTTLSFCFETEMLNVLETKGLPGAKNVDWSDPRDLHICIHPAMQDLLGGVALLARNKIHVLDDAEICPIDLELTLRACERLGRVEYVSSETAPLSEDYQFGASLGSYQTDVRLGFTLPEKWHDTSNEGIAAAISSTAPWTTFILDKPMLRLSVEDEVIHALAARDRVITSRDLWGASHESAPNNSIAHRFQDKAPSWLSVWKWPGSDWDLKRTHDHYRMLLAHKRSFGRLVEAELLQNLHRLPTDEELRMAILEYRDGDRRLERAMNSRNAMPSDWRDDRLLVLALLDAILQGGDCVFLTADRLMMEQYFTLCSSVSADYRAWHFGATTGQTMELREPEVNPNMKRAGFESTALFVRLDFEGAVNALPRHALRTQFACWLFDVHNSQMRVLPGWFSAERPMHAMMSHKEQNDGQSANLIGDQDVHWMQMVDSSGPGVTLWIGQNTRTAIDSRDFPCDLSGLDAMSVPTPSLILAQNFGDPVSLPWHADYPSREFLFDPTFRQSSSSG